MSEIPSDWSIAALILFGGAFTALAAGAAIFLAESWFEKMRQRREHFKIWQDQGLKIWQEQQRESFLRLDRMAKKAQSEVNQASGDNNEDDSQKNRPLRLDETVNDFWRRGTGEQTGNDALRDIGRKPRQADGRLSCLDKNDRNHRAEQNGRFSRTGLN